MRIGILTYHAVYNFGANLQALSTFMYLRKNGHEPIVIDFFPELLEKTFDKTVPADQAEMHKSFIARHVTMTKRCHNSSEIAKEISSNNIESVIIGSDAVVQHYPLLSRIKICPSRKKIVTFKIEPVHYETNFPNPFWGEFIEYLDVKVPVAMMSVSCQSTDYKLITGKEKKSMGKMIENFSYISVRDKRTQELFKHVSGNSCFPEITPDPVFGLNDNLANIPLRDDILGKYKLPDKYILLSFNSTKTVSKSWVSSFETIARQNGYRSIALAMPGGVIFENDLEHKIDIPLDPLDWYCIIKYSSAYIGEKMHPLIVSLLNSVPLFSFDIYGILRFKLFMNHKASKIYYILNRANLINHRVSIREKLKYRPPPPDFVFEKICSFNKEHCTVFANQMRNEYQTMMRSLIHKLQ